MSTEQSKSPLQFFAELGDLIARYAQNRDFAIGMVVISVILWPIGALIASLLIAKIYAQSRLAPTQTPPHSHSLTIRRLRRLADPRCILDRRWCILLGERLSPRTPVVSRAYRCGSVAGRPCLRPSRRWSKCLRRSIARIKYLFWGLVLILGGIAWRLALLGWFELSWRLVLPGILIILGVALLISGLAKSWPKPSDTQQGGPS
jgi:hypothetical protein